MLTLKILEKEIMIIKNEMFVRGAVGETCKIVFDNCWAKYEKIVVFKSASIGSKGYEKFVLDMNAEIDIPWEVLKTSGYLKIGVYGVDGADVSPTLWSDKIEIKDGTDTSGLQSAAATPGLMAQVVEVAGEAVSIAQSVRDDADSGKFKGDKGEPGEPGPAGPKGEDGKDGKDGVGEVTAEGGEIFNDYMTNKASAPFATATGKNNTASGQCSFVAGQVNTASGKRAASFGLHNTASGEDSVTFGFHNTVEGKQSAAFGEENTITSKDALVLGYGNEVSGNDALVSGYANKVSGGNGFASGGQNDVSGNRSFAANTQNKVLGENSAAFNMGNTVEGKQSAAFGEYNNVYAKDSIAAGKSCNIYATNDDGSKEVYSAFALGRSIKVKNPFQTAVGQFNNPDTDALFVVGNGTDNASWGRKNAFEVYKDGSVSIGGVKITPEQLTKILVLISSIPTE